MTREKAIFTVWLCWATRDNDHITDETEFAESRSKLRDAFLALGVSDEELADAITRRPK